MLESKAIDHSISQVNSLWVVTVDPSDQRLAHTELELYWQENLPQPVRRVTPIVIDSGWIGVLGYLAVIWALPAAEWFSAIDLRGAGRLHAAAITDGEWWRAITALTLHADLGHIASNSLFGALFGLFVGRYLGSGLGWLLVLLAGTAANFLNGVVQPAAFKAIGASTATFAALGLVPAFGWRRGYFRHTDWRRGFAPIFAAIALLGYTGFGGENIDVLGHIFGFTAGLLMGLAVAHIDLTARSRADQQRAGGFALLLIAVAWSFALAAG